MKVTIKSFVKSARTAVVVECRLLVFHVFLGKLNFDS
jgi:hypothetical protein